MKRVEGKVVVITGGGAGIGRACMNLFAREGAKVFAIGRTKSKLDTVVAEVIKAGGIAGSAAADLTKPAEVKQAFKAAMNQFGRVDILINSVGVGYSYGIAIPGTMNETTTTTPEHWGLVMANNLDTVFYTCRLVIPQMQKQGKGSIVNVASIYGMGGVENAHAYTASKGAMINYTRSLAVTYARDGIRSNTVCPGLTDTEMVASVMNLFDDPVVAEQLSPMKRAATPDEVAYACLYLGSDEASYCNGSLLTVDGGTSAR